MEMNLTLFGCYSVRNIWWFRILQISIGHWRINPWKRYENYWNLWWKV